MITGLTRNGPTTRRPSASGHVGSGRSGSRQAARADASIDSVARSPRVSRFACLQRWSMAFNSGSLAGVTGSDLQAFLGPDPGRLVLARTILEDHQVPTTPMGTYRLEERLMGVLGPILGDQQREMAARILIAPWSTPWRAPADRHPHLLADGTIAVIQRRCLRDDRLVQHQDYPARAILQAAFQPPFAWRQVSGRAANSCRGRFQRRPRRAIATLMLLTEAMIPWACSKWCCSNSAVQTVA